MYRCLKKASPYIMVILSAFIIMAYIVLNQPNSKEQKVIVLMYHHLLKSNENKIFKNNSAVISVGMFVQHMQYLKSQGYNTVDINQLEDFLYHNTPLPKSRDNISVHITFDDGYVSNYLYAYPVLKNCGYKASVFLVTSNISDENVYTLNPDLLQRFSYKQINDSDDVFDFGSHTHSFHSLADESDYNSAYLLTKPKQDIIQDLSISKELLNKTTYFCYPYGKYDEQTIEILKYLDFTLAFTTKRGTVKYDTDPFQIPRYGIFPNTSMNEFKSIFK